MFKYFNFLLAMMAFAFGLNDYKEDAEYSSIFETS